MRDLKKVIKRDWELYITELLICLVVTLVLFIKETQAQISYGDDFCYAISFFGFLEILGYIIPELFVPAMVICTFLYWWIFDDKGQKIFKASLPISSWQESKYDLISGYFICIVASIIVLLSDVFEYFMWRNAYGFEFVEGSGLFWFLDAIRFMLVGMCVYTLMVVGKRVASSIKGTLVFIVVFGSLVIYLEQFIEYDIIGDMLMHGSFSEDSILYNIGVIVGYLLLIVLLVIALVLASKKLDIAKGGTFYFKSVQILTCSLITIYIIYLADIVKAMKSSVLLGTGIIILAFLAGGGTYYLTSSRK